MEEERQARARTPEPRVPVVSRPTAARTQHMADIAKALPTRHNQSDDHGRVLCPTYPASTVNAPVPRVLAEALEVGTSTLGGGGRRDDSNADGGGGGGGPISRNQHSRGSSRGIYCVCV